MGYLMLLRHGHKLYKNGKAPKNMPNHDPPLDSNHDRKIVKNFLYNFISYGYPDIIYCSPFLRTRQTLDIVKKALPSGVVIIYDKRVEEFLGFQKPVGKLADLDNKTYDYTKPKLGVESLEMLKKRTRDFYSSIENSDKNILVITHGIFISNIALNLNYNKSYIKELNGILINKNTINSI